MPQLREGDFVPPLQLTDIHGGAVALPSRSSRYVHLQFRRYAGCPVCNLHMRTMTKSAKLFTDAGIQSVVIVASEDKPLLETMGGFPFQVVADPAKRIYEQFGVGTSPMAVLAPAAMGSAMKSLVSGGGGLLTGANADNLLILPAEFLVGPSGKIVACKYARHAADHWGPYELLGLAGKPDEGRKSA
jgi:peroxiredoxin